MKRVSGFSSRRSPDAQTLMISVLRPTHSGTDPRRVQCQRRRPAAPRRPVDEIRIHLVPLLLGAGTRLLDDTAGRVALESTETRQGSNATHLRYCVIAGP
jgi:hypothetical protein